MDIAFLSVVIMQKLWKSNHFERHSNTKLLLLYHYLMRHTALLLWLGRNACRFFLEIVPIVFITMPSVVWTNLIHSHEMNIFHRAQILMSGKWKKNRTRGNTERCFLIDFHAYSECATHFFYFFFLIYRLYCDYALQACSAPHFSD